MCEAIHHMFSEHFPAHTALGASRDEDPGLWASEVELADKWMDSPSAGRPPSILHDVVWGNLA